MSKRIAVVGVGLMGTSLARHLLAAGFAVTVHDLDPAKVEAIVKEGGKKADSPDRIASQVDVIMLSLPNSHIVNEVVKDTLRL
ncbi:MAG: NAD(P)-binding domain-containing protein, partial [Betaproteobacteria bacterium]|nr:NAD(P)-binding domain-containing protein [Betaproteobacteria bacterium]